MCNFAQTSDMINKSLSYKDIQDIVSDTGKKYIYVLEVLKGKRDCDIVEAAIINKARANKLKVEKIESLKTELETYSSLLPSNWAVRVSRKTDFSHAYIYMVKKGERENLEVLEAIVGLARKNLEKVTA